MPVRKVKPVVARTPEELAGVLGLPDAVAMEWREGTKSTTKKQKRLPLIHPGEVLQDLVHEAGLTVNALALALRVPANRIGGIVKGQRGITADTALRLGRYFGTSAQMWVNLQAKYDLAAAEDALREQIEREVLPRRAA
jgi:addiction module HigA family antidote